MANTLYLEVDKSNGAILSFYLDQPITSSDKVDYVPATKDELTYLSALEDAVFPAGMVATLSDLELHRTRVQAAKKAEATSPAIPTATAPQQPARAASKASDSSTTNFKNGFKRVRK